MLRCLERRSWFHIGRRGQAALVDAHSLNSRFLKSGNSLLHWRSSLNNQEIFCLRRLSALTDSVSSELIDILPNDSLIAIHPSSSSTFHSTNRGMADPLATKGLLQSKLLTPKLSSAVLGDGYAEDGLHVDVVVHGSSSEEFDDVSTSRDRQHPSRTGAREDLLESKGRAQHDLALPLSASSHSVQNPEVAKLALTSLIKSVHGKNAQAAMNAFNQLMAINDRSRIIGAPLIEIPAGVVKGLFRLIQPARTFDIFNVVEYYVSIPNTIEHLKDGGNLSAYTMYYHVVCDSIAYLDPRHSYKGQCMTLLTAVIDRLSRLDRRGQELCVPRLLNALVEQHSTQLGKHFTGKIYRYLIDNDFNVSPGFWLRILALSRYNRQDELPFDDILSRVVESGLQPHPYVILNVLENFFPFSNSQAVAKSLKAILILQRQVAAEIKAVKTETAGESAEIRSRRLSEALGKQYFVDITVLESIGATAASQGESEICLMIWDMIDTLGYTPTEGIYENTIVAFAMNPFTYREAFIVLNEMESRGFIPSRALLRSVSLRVRDSVGNLDFAQDQILLLRREGKVAVTTSIMNVLLSSAAERGDIDRVLSILHDFDRYGTAFNADTISFGFESLGKNLSRRRKYNRTFVDSTNPATRDHIGACMVVANALLNQMDDYQIETTDHIIRNYIEFLCLAGYIDTATAIILEAVGRKGLVSSKSIYRVAMMNAKAFKFDIARQIAHCDVNNKPMQFLLDAIGREEHLYGKALKQSYGQQYPASVKSDAISYGSENMLSVDEDEQPYVDNSHLQEVPQLRSGQSNFATFWKTDITNDGSPPG